ncbi:MAG: BatD family protein [Alloprevotella sp.]
MTKKIFISLVCAWMLSLPLVAQLQLEVTAPQSVDINEPYFQIKYTVRSAETSDFRSPTIQGFDILSGPNTSVSRSYTSVNGRSKSEGQTVYTYTLEPTSKGTFRISAASVVVGGKTIHSKALTIKVDGHGTRQPEAGQSSPSSSQNAQAPLRHAGSDVTASDLSLSGRLSTKKVYEQQAAVLTYEFLEKPGVGLSQVGLNQKPDFKDIVSQELPVSQIDATTTRVGQTLYRTGVIGRYLLYPQKPGRLTIPAITFNCTVVQRDAYLDPLDAFFNGGGTMGVNVNRQTQPLELEVLPLPTPRPQGFSGGVGQMHIDGKLIYSDQATGEMMTYRVTVSGVGNLRLLSAPSITFPTDFETYTPKVTDNTEVTLEGVKGQMVFDYTFVPRNVGRYDIPPIDFIYFDPDAGQYKTITVPAKSLDIHQGTLSEDELEAIRRMREGDIRPIHTDGSRFTPADGRRLWNTPGYWLAYVGIVAILCLLSWATRGYAHLKGSVSGRLNKASKVALRRLKSAQKLLKSGEERAYYSTLAEVVTDYLCKQCGLAVNGGSTQQTIEQLQQKDVPEALINEAADILQKCDTAGFAAQTEATPETLHRQAVDLISHFEAAIKSGSHSSSKQPQP